MYPKKVAQDTAKVLKSYLTFQAVRTIIHQLSETNPGESLWLAQYSDQQKVQDDEAYLEGLMLEHKDLVLRIMTVREHLAEAVLDFLPAMVRSDIHESNLDCRRRLLERLTQTPASDPIPSVDDADPESDSKESSD